MNCDSLIFDLDGTLWDASEAVSQSWAHTLRNTYQVKNPPSIAEIQSIMGLSAREIADRLFSRYGEDPDEIAQYCMRQECDYLAVHGGRLYAGVEPTLRDLAQHYHLSIVSNCQQGYIESFLHFYHLEPLFTDFDCEGNTGLKQVGKYPALNQEKRFDASCLYRRYADGFSGSHAGLRRIHLGFLWLRACPRSGFAD